MKRRIIALVLVFVMALTMNAFAYRWEERNGHWYVLNEQTGEHIKGTLLDTGNGVYYLNEEGRLVTGWYLNRRTNRYYYFDNNPKRNLGAMVFGLHMVDGYYYYFGDDGSLQTAHESGEYRKVFQDYFADVDGYLYKDNKLMRDTSIIRSEYYTNAAYYENINFNNYYLANYDQTSIGKRQHVVQSATSNSYSNGSAITSESKKTSDAHKTSGGTNYYVDEWGTVHEADIIYETRPAEKYGPMIDPK